MRTRPRATPPDELLLFVTEPQQLDAVHEYGTETLTVDSIRVNSTAFVVRVPGLDDLGPYTRTDAETALDTYRALGITDAQIVKV